MSYCFDTSAFIEPWVRHYPPSLFPDFWDRIDQMASDGNRVFATEEVRVELERIQDDLHKWVKERSHLILELDTEVQKRVSTILADHRRLLNLRQNRSAADAFVIAHAAVREAVVVTEERPSNTTRTLRIPDVCSAIGIECIDIVTFMRRENMVFRLR